MPLEATMIIIDNSEFMRNGDYQPSRFDSQSDAVNTIFQTKIDSNPENFAGVMTMAGKTPEVLVTYTKDVGQILQAIHTASSKIGGAADIPTAIAVAQLALKHRQNKNLRQRIVVFAASPLEGQGADERNMIKLAKKLKKNNVAVDVIAFGDGIEEGEHSILKSFVENANSSDNSHYLSIPPGPHLLSDIVLTSPILAGDRGIPEEAMGEAGAPVAGGTGFEFGVDPSLDPELAMALRMSMEEENARQAAQAAAAASAAQPPPQPPQPTEPAAASTSTTSAAPPPAVAPATTTEDVEIEDDEEAMLQQALALSQQQAAAGEGEAPARDEDHEMSEEEAIAKAIQMSMKENPQEEKK
ncbi:unnamed protein product [Somion occarium]|uniref:VWFA domain-containing protein n=1 Tax=Somion occarium TaxID=3059160 RepID=A0ABP1D5D7_9APHY